MWAVEALGKESHSSQETGGITAAGRPLSEDGKGCVPGESPEGLVTQLAATWAVSSVGVGDWPPGSPRSLDQWGYPRIDGPDCGRACGKPPLFGLLAPCVPDSPSSEERRQRRTTTADGSGRVDGGPRAGLFDPRPAGRWSAGGLREGCPAAARAARPGARLPSRLPAAAGGEKRGAGGSSARGLLSQGWPSLFDKLIAWRGLAGPGVTPVTTKVELEEIRLKERGEKN